MIADASYRETFEKIGILPTASAVNFNAREKEFLNERGWWTTSQVLLKTVISLEELRSVIQRDSKVAKAVENARRCRLILAFSDGTKPDHSVVSDQSDENVVFDPARGVIPISELFADVGLQSYSGTLGIMSYSFQPGQPTEAWIITEEGFIPPTT